MVLVIILQVWVNHEANEALLTKAIPDNSNSSSSRVVINIILVFLIVYLI